MNLTSLLHKQCVQCPLRSLDLKGVIRELVNMSANAGLVTDSTRVLNSIKAREDVRSACTQFGTYFPRVVSHGVTEAFVAVGKLARPIACPCGKHAPMTLVILFLAPPPKNLRFLKTFVAINIALSAIQSRDSLMSAKKSDDLYQGLTEVFGKL